MPATDTQVHTADVTNESPRRVAAEAARGLLDDSSEVGRKLFNAWVTGAEATLKATFELQNASLAAGRSLLQQWDCVAQQAQEATLDAFHAQARPATRVHETARR
jgi:hypothetical protein